MTVVAVISDVHANSLALEAVLDDARERGAEAVYCLGDVVGYNARPRETLRALRINGIPIVKGNHDMMASGELPIERCGPNARASQLWTRQVLDPAELWYLRGLPTELWVHEDTLLVHSRLGDPVSHLARDQDYMDEFERIRRRRPATRVCFTGHTHLARVIEISPRGELRRLAQAAPQLRPDCFYFINPGSVGHPRGGDFRASYALFDRRCGQVRLLRVRYDKSRMLQANRAVDLHTDLGPGVLEHEFARLARQLKRAFR